MSFEDVMMRRLAECGTEACQEIERGLEAGRPLGDAILDAIESLPADETRDLRRWLKDWEAWEEWKAFEKLGWHVQRHKGGYIELGTPLNKSLPHVSEWPAENVVAAAAAVPAVVAMRSGWDYRHERGGSRFRRVYNIIKR